METLEDLGYMAMRQGADPGLPHLDWNEASAKVRSFDSLELALAWLS